MPDSMTQSQSARSVLVVDDDAVNQLMMNDFLTEMGYDVSLAYSGEEALEQFDEGAQPQIVLIDIVMPPGMDGLELADKLRARYAHLPIVYVSGRDPSDYKIGNTPFLQKPIRFAQLSEVLDDVLPKRRLN